MARRKNIPLSMLKAALRRNAGVYVETADELGVSRQCVRQRVEASPELRHFIEDLGEEALDLAENAVIQRLEEGDLVTARWYLERRGRSRGYGRGGFLDQVALERVAEGIVQAMDGDVGKLHEVISVLEGV